MVNLDSIVDPVSLSAYCEIGPADSVTLKYQI